MKSKFFVKGKDFRAVLCEYKKAQNPDFKKFLFDWLKSHTTNVNLAKELYLAAPCGSNGQVFSQEELEAGALELSFW